MSRCLYPFSSLMISPQGKARLCSSSLDTMGDLAASGVREVWDGKPLEEVRKRMSQGVWPRACRGCERSEEKGLPSKRQKFFESRRKVWGDAVCEEAMRGTEPSLMHLDLSFSNLCNLSCVTCSSYYSTGWSEKETKARQEGLDFQESKGVLGARRLPPERIDELLRDFLPGLRTILIKGGEPLVDPECLRFLKGLAASTRRREDLSVFIQTNGTRMTSEIAAMLAELRAEVGFSIDGTGDVFRWIRGGNFDEVIENMTLLSASPGVRGIFLDATVSAFNVTHLPSLAEFSLDLKAKVPLLKSCTMMGWANQDYLSPRLLPLALRLETIGRLDAVTQRDPGFFQGLEALRGVLSGPELRSEALEKFRRWMAYCNRLRGFEIETFCPELRGL